MSVLLNVAIRRWREKKIKLLKEDIDNMSTVTVKVPAKRKSTKEVEAKKQMEIIKEENKMAEETKTTTRKSTRQSTGSSRPAVQERPATKRRLGTAAVQAGGTWYLKDTADLEGVTDEATNDALGIREIKVYEPSEAQWNNGTVATITLETIIGQIKGIAVVESNRDDSLYVRMQSRSYDREGQKQYVNDVALDRKVQAQILRYVDKLLVEA